MIPSVITDTNAAYWGVDFSEVVDQAAAQVAQLLLKRYGSTSGFNFVCGFGHKAALGFATARHLIAAGVSGPVGVYLVGRPQQFKRAAAKAHWDKISRLQTPNLEVIPDAYAANIPRNDVTVECLVGTGFHGKAHKRFRDVITRIVHFKKPIVAIDQPFPGYSWDYSVSLQYPKTADAEVVTVPLPSVVEEYVGPGEVAALFQPRRHTYKSDNGKLVVISATNSAYHALTEVCVEYAVSLSVYYVDSAQQGVLTITASQLEESLAKADAVLFAGDFTSTLPARALCTYICLHYPSLRFIWNVDAASFVDKPVYSIVITDRARVRQLFAQPPRNIEIALVQAKRMAAVLQQYLVIHGSQDIIYGINPYTKQLGSKLNRPQQLADNQLDRITSWIAAYATKNEPWLAATAGVFTASHKKGDAP